MKCYAPGWVRWTATFLAVAGLLDLVAAFRSGGGLDFVWAPLMLVFYGWIACVAWTRPTVKVDRESVAWRPVFDWRYQTCRRDEIVAVRQQDSFDLRLQLTTGEERSLHLAQISRRDRPALIELVRTVRPGAPGSANA